jgi:hypothetical protein
VISVPVFRGMVPILELGNRVVVGKHVCLFGYPVCCYLRCTVPCWEVEIVINLRDNVIIVVLLYQFLCLYCHSVLFHVDFFLLVPIYHMQSMSGLCLNKTADTLTCVLRRKKGAAF